MAEVTELRGESITILNQNIYNMTPAPKAQRTLESRKDCKGQKTRLLLHDSVFFDRETAAMKSQQYTSETSKITTWLACYHR